MQSLVIDVLIHFPVHLVLLLELRVDVLQSLLLICLLLSVVLEHSDSLTHLFLHEHVVLHATLQDFLDLSTLVGNPASISLLIQIGIGHLIHVHQNISRWLH